MTSCEVGARMVFAAFAAASLAACVSAATVPSADLVLRGGAVYTVDEKRSWASAVAIDDGRIVFVGDDAGVARYVGADTHVIELSGRMLLPGFHDSHTHPMSGGMRYFRCKLGGLAWPEEVYAALRACAADRAQGEWLIATDLSHVAFEGTGPSRHVLDELVPDRPAYVRTVEGDTIWVNSRTLAIAGIDAATPDPRKGRIERHPESGEPSGTLRGSAAGVVWSLLPPPDAERYREALRRSSDMANRYGITSVIDARVDERMLAAYAEADRAGELTLRVLASLRIDPRRGAEQVDDLVTLREGVHSPRLRASSAKIFVDGDLSKHTAAMLQPYADAPDDRGELYIPAQTLEAIVTRLDAAGFQVHMHVMGDRAIRIALDTLARAMQANGPRERRHHLAHLGLPDPKDIPRFALLGVAANIQPVWAQADDPNAAHAEAVLGHERARRLYPIASLFRSGARVVAGSDWPSLSMNPLDAIQIAMTRRPLDGSKPVWLPDEQAGLAEMIAAYTIAGARLAGREATSGSIEAGKDADLIVLDHNLFEVAPEALKEVRVQLTLLDGEPVYRADDL